ncbi:phosphatase IMPL1, chloroplastic-like [Lycium barbarum]|uniref:phosphatase IMPL1, chloroplastic-like n=1 Tax=Lycium barbarum TaxID=112863 RepID=UPI00293F1ACD|nr:phosphatase IMPL1, chloroplastic-like [Lycium barbarum]
MIMVLRICQLPRILLPYNLSFPRSCSTKHGFCTSFSTRAKTNGAFCTKATLSELGNKKVYSKIGADSTGSIPSSELLQVVEVAAKTGAQVVMDAVNKPRNVTYKGLTDLVTDVVSQFLVSRLTLVRFSVISDSTSIIITMSSFVTKNIFLYFYLLCFH